MQLLKRKKNAQPNKADQTTFCSVMDGKIGTGSPLSPEYQQLIYDNEKNYSEIVQSYTHYTRAIVWMNFIFKVVYFIGSCVLLWVVTRSLLDVVSQGLDHSVVKAFLRRILLSDGVSTTRSVEIEMLLTSLTAFITAVIVIPLTITKYLFNQKEVEQFTALLSSVQQHNEKMFGIRTGHKDSVSNNTTHDSKNQQDKASDLDADNPPAVDDVKEEQG